MNSGSLQRNIYTVSRLTGEIKGLLEKNYPMVWINGEISNFSSPASGHFYFTLKDSRAQISSVIFRGQNRHLTFRPENGLRITGLGRLSLYEPRGAYQIIFEYLEPEGVGALQIAFEQLKAKLADEGYFEQDRKRAIPFLPSPISVVTSPTGAVVHDIINVATRRFPGVRIEIVPVRVQGNGAECEIAAALDFLNEQKKSEVIIVARGGGSLEDLAAFNSETVAKAIFRSAIPVISAVGHETDFSIADFVADLRAPTPSAAAEMAVPSKAALLKKVALDTSRLKAAIDRMLNGCNHRLEGLLRRLTDPRRKVDDARLRVDELEKRLIRAMDLHRQRRREHLDWRTGRLYANNPANMLRVLGERKRIAERDMAGAIGSIITRKRAKLAELAGRLEALSPKAILQRGYSITRTIPGAKVVTDSLEVRIGRDVEVLLAEGALVCTVKEKI